MCDNYMVQLDRWEMDQLKSTVNARLLTYMGHQSRGGLFPEEIKIMEKYKALSDKLDACPATNPKA